MSSYHFKSYSESFMMSSTVLSLKVCISMFHIKKCSIEFYIATLILCIELIALMYLSTYKELMFFMLKCLKMCLFMCFIYSHVCICACI